MRRAAPSANRKLIWPATQNGKSREKIFTDAPDGKPNPLLKVKKLNLRFETLIWNR